MEALDFEVDGVAYQAQPINGFVALHLSSLLSPVVVAGSAELFATVKELRTEFRDRAKREASSQEMFEALLELKPKIPIEDLLRSLGPAAQYLARMKQEDRLFVLSEALKGVGKREADRYVPIWSASAGRPIDDALFYNLPLMLRIAWPVLNRTLGGFFPTSL